MDEMAPKYAYWNIRGLAEPVRYLLHYTGTEFEDKRFHFGPGPDYNVQQWFDVKFTLGLDFPNLPYYMDGDLKITQSTVILRHLARKHGLVVTSEEDVIKQELVEQQAVDLRTALIRLGYNEKFEKEKEEYIKKLPPLLKMFSDFLGEKQWMMGEKLTYVDFLVYEAIDFHRFLVPTCVDEFINLKDYLTRFESIPAIAKYMKSEAFVKWPIFSPYATFGGK